MWPKAERRVRPPTVERMSSRGIDALLGFGLNSVERRQARVRELEATLHSRDRSGGSDHPQIANGLGETSGQSSLSAQT